MIEASWNAASWLPTEELGQSRLPAAELPEVVAAENEGYWLAPESPMWVLQLFAPRREQARRQLIEDLRASR